MGLGRLSLKSEIKCGIILLSEHCGPEEKRGGYQLYHSRIREHMETFYLRELDVNASLLVQTVVAAWRSPLCRSPTPPAKKSHVPVHCCIPSTTIPGKAYVNGNYFATKDRIRLWIYAHI